MKKIIYSLVLMVLAFFAASCQQENLEPVTNGSTVTYTVQIPDVITTRAAGSERVDSLIYQVYREADISDLTKLPIYTGTADINESGTAELVMEFVRNQKFVVLFWAQNSNVDVYTTDDLRQVSLANLLTANDFTTEVFSGIDTVDDCVSSNKGEVDLKRPIAQINIATSQDGLTVGDPAKGNTTTVELNESEVTVEGLFTTYNVYNQNVSGEGDFTYAKAEVPAGDFKTDYPYVAMTYVGFADKTGTNVDVKFNIYTSEGNIEHTVNNVPVKANYRTNILGNLITGTAGYAVSIDNDWATDNNVEVVSVSNAQDLQDVINDAPVDGTELNIKLEGNIDLSQLEAFVSTKADPTVPTYGLLIPAGRTLVLDLNGATIQQEITQTSAYSMIVNEGTLTIVDSKEGGKISYSDKGIGGEYVSNTLKNDGTLIIEGGLIENNSNVEVATNGYPHAIDNNGVLTINGGTLTNLTKYSSMRIWVSNTDPEKCVVTINGGTFNGSIDFQAHNNNYATIPHYGTLIINGGTFNATKDDSYAFRVLRFGVNVEDMVATINGGDFNGKVGVRDWTNTECPAIISIAGGTFSEKPSDFVAEGYCVKEANSEYEVVPAAAKIGKTGYMTLAAAVAAVQEGETIEVLTTIEEGTIKLPTSLKNVTFLGNENALLKDMTISAADGNAYNYQYLTFDGLTFENSGILLTGWRNGDEVIENLTITNCTFKNLDNTTSTAPVHINKDAPEAVKNFTFTNNVIDGATGGSKSGVYAQLTGNIEFTGNVINNVSFRPYVIQITTDDGIADNFVVSGNTFSGSSVGRAQGLGNNAEGTDNVTLVVSGNIFKGITSAQQICYWNFNAAKTTVDLSQNYYDIDILANPSKIYYNAAATSEADLAGMNVFPIYTELNADGTINRNSAYSPAPVQIGEAKYNTLEEAVAAAKEGDTISLIDNVTLASELKLPANVILNGNGKQIEGTIYAGGNLTFVGHTKVTSFSASYYNRTITIGEGACLEVTGNGRVTLGYGNTFNITGNLDDAKTADKSKIQPSLIIPGGISITGGSDAIMNVTNAYVQIGSTSSKNSAANGEFTLNFTNSIAEFTNQLTFAEPTNGMNPIFNLNVTNSVLTTGTKLVAAAPNSNVMLNNSKVTLATYFRNSGMFDVVNGSVLTGSTIQFGENGGNDGQLNVDNSNVTINASSTGHALDGKGTGKINAINGAEVKVTYYKGIEVTTDASSTFTGTEVQ